MTRTLRIVHTSDWHLGHTLHGHDREHEHGAFLEWLLSQLETLEADALLVAGDIFHTASPSASARRMFFDFVGELRDRVPHVTPIVIGGNHDSAAHLDAPDALFARLGVRVVGGMSWTSDGYDVDRALVPIRKGDDVVAWVAAVPFLRPSDLDPAALRDQGQAGAIAAAYDAVLGRALERRDGPQPILAMGHGTMAGGRLSDDSERRVTRGGEDALPVELFGEEVSYVALGHLHLAQSVGGLEHVRYSGSPIPLAMSEEGYEHQVLVADFEGSRLTEVRSLRVPRTVPLIRFQHDEPLPIDETLEKLRALDYADRPLHERPFLEVAVRVDRAEPRLDVVIREAVANLPVRLVRIRRERHAAAETTLADVVERHELSALKPTDVFRLMHERSYGKAPDDELLQAFAELELRVGEVA